MTQRREADERPTQVRRRLVRTWTGTAGGDALRLPILVGGASLRTEPLAVVILVNELARRGHHLAATTSAGQAIAARGRGSRLAQRHAAGKLLGYLYELPVRKVLDQGHQVIIVTV